MSLCRVISLGKVTSWGKTFLEGLQKEELIDLKVYPNVEAFLNAENLQLPHIVFMENIPECRHWIEKLRDSDSRIYIALFGENFSKEDLAFALRNRVYCTFENTSADSYDAMEHVKHMAEFVQKEKQFDSLVRSLKTILLEAEGDVANSVMGELKAAVNKLGKSGGFDEFSKGEDAGENSVEKDEVFPESENFFDVLQAVDSLERTGILWVKGNQGGEEGQVSFLQGKIVGAQCGAVTGLKAIYRMLLWDKCHFAFSRRSHDEMELSEPINVGVNHVLMEGLRYKNHYKRLLANLPPHNIVLELDPQYFQPGMSLPPNDFSTLASVVEFGKVSEILDYTPLPDVMLYESLINLRRLNVIRIAA